MEAATSGTDEPVHEASVDDQFRAVLEGLRTTLPGTQALFGFLLILPFQQSFSDLTGGARASYFIAFLAAALASVLLIAPAAHQRLRAPRSGVRRRSRRHLRIAVWITIVGTITFAVSLVAAVFLVSLVVFSSLVAGIAGAAVTAVTAVTWFYVPLVTFNRVE